MKFCDVRIWVCEHPLTVVFVTVSVIYYICMTVKCQCLCYSVIVLKYLLFWCIFSELISIIGGNHNCDNMPVSIFDNIIVFNNSTNIREYNWVWISYCVNKCQFLVLKVLASDIMIICQYLCLKSRNMFMSIYF